MNYSQGVADEAPDGTLLPPSDHNSYREMERMFTSRDEARLYRSILVRTASSEELAEFDQALRWTLPRLPE